MADLSEFGSLDIASAEEWSGERKPVPAGEYVVVVVAAGVKDTKAGDKQYVSVEYSILEGEYRNRRIFDSFFLWVQSRVPLSKFKSLRIALGLNGNVLGDTDDLVNGELRVGVDVEEQEGYRARNRVTVYKPLRDGKAAAPKASKPAAKPRPAAPKAAPSESASPFPWVDEDEA